MTTVSAVVLVLLALGGLSNGYITRIAVRLPLGGTPAPPGSPWPVPQSWTYRPDLMTLDPADLSMTSNTDGCDVIDKLIDRYQSLLKDTEKDGERDPDLPMLRSLHIEVEDKVCGRFPRPEEDESYSIIIDGESTARLAAKTIWGAIRGMETFSQFIFISDDGKFHVNHWTVTDFPRYTFRGVHIDTARHFLTVSTILTILDTMAWNKFNVLHWHVVDDQSFPYPSRSFPNLTEMGSFSEYHRYSREDVALIVAEARLRGIRVIPEFDTPGHTWSWGFALPLLITPCWGGGLEGGPYVPDYPNFGPREVVNPSLEYTYDTLTTFWREIIEDFPDDYVHLGLDEAYYSCWKSNPNISEWMARENLTTYAAVEQYYSRRLLALVAGLGGKSVIWQDPIDNGVTVQDDTLVTVWKDSSMGLPGQFADWQEYMRNVTDLGYSALLAAPWYLNSIKYGQRWRDLYMVEPTNFTDDPAKAALVKGGEFCTWAEWIDGGNILSIMWPEGSAVGERLWSAQHETDVDSAAYRLDQQRCRMLRRGIPTKPVLPGYCGAYEWEWPRRPVASSAPTTYGPAETSLVLVLAGVLLWGN